MNKRIRRGDIAVLNHSEERTAFHDPVWVSALPITAEALMGDLYFRRVVKMNVFTRGYMVMIQQGFEKRILGLMEQNDGELEEREK